METQEQGKKRFKYEIHMGTDHGDNLHVAIINKGDEVERLESMGDDELSLALSMTSAASSMFAQEFFRRNPERRGVYEKMCAAAGIKPRSFDKEFKKAPSNSPNVGEDFKNAELEWKRGS